MLTITWNSKATLTIARELHDEATETTFTGTVCAGPFEGCTKLAARSTPFRNAVYRDGAVDATDVQLTPPVRP
ncbi:MAG: hypothetical protein ACLPVY_21590 [Acidimicrobiia bacterium]